MLRPDWSVFRPRFQRLEYGTVSQPGYINLLCCQIDVISLIDSAEGPAAVRAGSGKGVFRPCLVDRLEDVRYVGRLIAWRRWTGGDVVGTP